MWIYGGTFTILILDICSKITCLKVWQICKNAVTYGSGIFTRKLGPILKLNWIQVLCTVILAVNYHRLWLFLVVNATGKFATISGSSILVCLIRLDYQILFAYFCVSDTESWEKISISGPKPQPRSESRSFIVSELILKGSSKLSLETRSKRIRARTCNSADRGNRHSSYLPNNKVAPYENTYVFEPTELNYTDGTYLTIKHWSYLQELLKILGSNLAEQYAEPGKNTKSSLLQEISKLSQINLQRINSRCGGYTVLSKGTVTESTESLLRQHSTSQPEPDYPSPSILSTPCRGSINFYLNQT